MTHWIRQLRNDLRDQGAREFEGDALRRGIAGVLYEYHCFQCHARHFIWSAIGQRHEQFGNPAVVKACKRESLLFQQREFAEASR